MNASKLSELEQLALTNQDWISTIKAFQPRDWQSYIEEIYQIPFFEEHQIQITDQLLSYQEMYRYKILLAEYKDQFILILPSPWHNSLSSLLKPTEEKVDIYFSSIVFIEHYLQKIQSFSSTQNEENHSLHTDLQNENIEILSLSSIANAENEVIQIVNSTLYEAYIQKASDIHFENYAGGLHIRYRLDGILISIKKIQNYTLIQQIVSRIKVLAELDIGERRIPQDGRFSVNLEHKILDFRVSIMPGVFGEDAVLRILDKDGILKEGQQLSLNDLGYPPDFQGQLRQIASQPYGMVLLTGPTGSGKTTTVYALINETLKPYEKLITVEDPVEYALNNALQIPINEKKGLTFAKGLRSILRHDPDKILVGEIRDKETGEIAIQAALTGHLVFTTVHANHVFDVIGRFQHMEIDQYNLVSALNGIVAQRLIRLLCKHCKKPNGTYEFLAMGCSECNHTGYKGRKAIAEILVLNDELKELIINRASIREMKQISSQHGLLSMRDYAMSLVDIGETTLEEVNRVTFQ